MLGVEGWRIQPRVGVLPAAICSMKDNDQGDTCFLCFETFCRYLYTRVILCRGWRGASVLPNPDDMQAMT